jgi:hypothetical protein
MLLRPLIGYSNSFYKDKCINTFINPDIVGITLKMNNVENDKSDDYKYIYITLKNNPLYRGDFKHDNFLYINMYIGNSFVEDYHKFLIGKYSKFSDQAKMMIYDFYFKNTKDFIYVDQVLNPTKTNFNYISEKCGVPYELAEEVGEAVSIINHSKELITTNILKKYVAHE